MTKHKIHWDNDHFFDDWSNWSKSNIKTLLRQRTFLNCKLVLQWNNFLKNNKKIIFWESGTPIILLLNKFYSKDFFVRNVSNSWMVWRNGTTSVPKSVLRYVVDKVKLFVPIWGPLFQCLCPELKFSISLSHICICIEQRSICSCDIIDLTVWVGSTLI